MKRLYTTLLILSTFALTQGFSQCFTTQNFNNPGTYTYTVPGATNQAYTIEIEARGGDGGDFLWGGNPPSAGGSGATMEGEFTVFGGDQFFIVVGQSGQDALGSPGGGGGGGGSAVVINSSDVLIAAAAGGGGGQNNVGEGAFANTNSLPQGGAAPGASGGGGFNSPGQDGANSTGGGAGTLTSQGLGGTQGVVAGPGGNGFGGGGGGAGTGGGGGGGYQGGDGASNGSLNGKGGDSYINTLYSGTIINTTAGITGNGFNVNGNVTILCSGTVSSDLAISVINQSDPLCFGGNDGSIEVAASGGAGNNMYSIGGGSFTTNPLFTGLTAGTYTVSVTDANNITVSVMVVLSDPTELTGQTLQINNNDCFDSQDASIEVVGIGGTVTNGYTYSLNGGTPQSSGLFTNLITGPHTITIFDDNNCSVDINETITSTAQINAIIINSFDVTCFGGSDGTVTVFADGGTGAISYSIDGVNFQIGDQFDNLAVGTYTLTARDINDCQGTTTFSIGEPQALVLTSMATPITCNGANDGSITLIGSGGSTPYFYSLDNVTFDNNSTFSGLAAGSYTGYIKDANDCDASEVNIMISEPAGITIIATTEDPSCHPNNGTNDGSIITNITGGSGTLIYTWSSNDGSGLVPGAENQTMLSAGTYNLNIADAGNCSTDTVLTLGSPTELIIASTITQPQCNAKNGVANGSIEINPSGGANSYEFEWTGIGVSSTEQNLSNLYGGSYNLVVTDTNNCMAMMNFELTEPDSIEITLMGQDLSCNSVNGMANGAISSTVSGGTSPYSYGWSTFDGGGLSPMMMNQSDLVAGTYGVIVTDTFMCSAEANVLISEPEVLLASIDAIVSASCTDGTNGSAMVSAMGGTPPYQFILGDTSMTGSFTNLIAGDYNLMIIDANNCSTSQTVNIPQIGGIDMSSTLVSFPTCAGDTNGSIDIGAVGGSGTYSYTLDGVAISSPTITDLGAGEYIVVVSDDQGCQSQSVYTLSEPDSLLATVIDITNDTGGANGGFTISPSGGTLPYSYSLDKGTTKQDSPTFSDLVGMIYEVTVTDANGCTFEVMVNILLTSNQNIDPAIQNLSIFPNPVSDFITIEVVLDSPIDMSLNLYQFDGSNTILVYCCRIKSC